MCIPKCCLFLGVPEGSAIGRESRASAQYVCHNRTHGDAQFTLILLAFSPALEKLWPGSVVCSALAKFPPHYRKGRGTQEGRKFTFKCTFNHAKTCRTNSIECSAWPGRHQCSTAASPNRQRDTKFLAQSARTYLTLPLFFPYLLTLEPSPLCARWPIPPPIGLFETQGDAAVIAPYLHVCRPRQGWPLQPATSTASTLDRSK